MKVLTDMKAYYGRRAEEYEQVYAKPERQADLAGLRLRVAELCAGRAVYEVACGTGYWTQFVAEAAQAVFATDVNDAVLELARRKPVPAGRVTFAQADAFDPPVCPFAADTGLAAFWWSHLRMEESGRFVVRFLARLRPGARVVLLDNRYVEGSSTPISRTDEAGNTYQRRRLADGSEHEVLKNFPDETALRRVLAPHLRSLSWEPRDHYWLAWGEAR